MINRNEITSSISVWLIGFAFCGMLEQAFKASAIPTATMTDKALLLFIR